MATQLTPEEVATLARAGGLRVLTEDLPEVTVRVNAFVDGLAPLDELPLETVQPIPALPHPQEPE
ncbi:MAG TPA: hypothetical protein VMQ78_04950 [Candidatus Limnocylindria bacterium]|nr:hypothetical protein [Candidatus Limnocylindria bacterium]